MRRVLLLHLETNCPAGFTKDGKQCEDVTFNRLLIFCLWLMNNCRSDCNLGYLSSIQSRIIYFGGYGHKLQTDVDSRNRNFIIDEVAWVTFLNAIF